MKDYDTFVVKCTQQCNNSVLVKQLGNHIDPAEMHVVECLCVSCEFSDGLRVVSECSVTWNVQLPSNQRNPGDYEMQIKPSAPHMKHCRVI